MLSFRRRFSPQYTAAFARGRICVACQTEALFAQSRTAKVGPKCARGRCASEGRNAPDVGCVRGCPIRVLLSHSEFSRPCIGATLSRHRGHRSHSQRLPDQPCRVHQRVNPVCAAGRRARPSSLLRDQRDAVEFLVSCNSNWGLRGLPRSPFGGRRCCVGHHLH